MNYQWDPEKAASNLKKHGIDFADSVGVFEDDWALTIRQHDVEGELRFATLGVDLFGRVIVVYTYRNNDIRVISARRATKKERKVYEQKRRI